MTLSSEEQQTLHTEELKKRAKGFRLKFLNEGVAAEQILSTLDDESLEDKKLLESFIWREMVLNLPPDKEIFRHLDLMALLPQARLKAEPLEALRSSFKSGFKEAAEERKKTVIREKKKLAAMGISGNAVIPRMPKDMEDASPAQTLLIRYRPLLLDGI